MRNLLSAMSLLPARWLRRTPDNAATRVGREADQAANMKSAKYAVLTANYIFQPIAVENMGPINSSALSFLNNLGQRICTVSGNTRPTL